MLGGDITVLDSYKDSGTTFRISIATGSLENVDLIDAEEATKQTIPTPKTQTVIQYHDALSDIRILVVEDNPTNQMVIRGILCRAGAEVVTVENGKQALIMALDASSKGDAYHVILNGYANAHNGRLRSNSTITPKRVHRSDHSFDGSRYVKRQRTSASKPDAATTRLNPSTKQSWSKR